MTYLQSIPLRIAMIPLVVIALVAVQIALIFFIVTAPVFCMVADVTQGKKFISKSPFKGVL